MAKKYLDDIGLSHFFDKLKLLFATKDAATQSADGLMSSSDKTKLDGLDHLVESTTGESVTVGDGSGFESVVVYGKSVQDGTPTPSAPVSIDVVSGLSMPSSIAWIQGGVSNSTGGEGSDANRIHTAMFEIVPGAAYSVGVTNSNYNYSVRLFRNNTFTSSSLVYGDSVWKSAEEAYSNQDAKYMCVVIKRTDNANITPTTGAEVGLYANTDCIGLQVNDTITPIDLQGNVLASLPDGTKDLLIIDSIGHITLTKNVGVLDLGDLTWTYNSNNRTIFYSQALPEMKFVNTPYVLCECYSTCSQVVLDLITAQSYLSDGQISGRYVESGNNYLYVKDLRYTSAASMKSAVAGYKTYYPLAASQTIDLGYIDMPGIPNDSQVSITASIVPTIEVSWWTKYAEPIVRAIASIKNLVI